MSDRDRWEARYAHSPQSRLRPSRFVEDWSHLIHGRVLDIASGKGRHALFAARLGLQVDAIDIALPALTAIRAAADAETLRINTIQADLTTFPLPASHYDTIIHSRYLQRTLFDSVINSLRPGGILLFETFLIDQRELGHPSNPEYLLEHDELRAAFAELETIFYAEGLVTNDGEASFLVRLCARKFWHGRPPASGT